MSSAIHKRRPAQSHTTSSTRGRATPTRLVVLAADTSDAVAAAGGLIYDSVRAGWHVDVYVEKTGDERALQILGVGGRIMPHAFDFETLWPDAVYLDAELYERHRHVRRMVADSERRQHADIAVWHYDSLADPLERPGIEHRLSTAARAFKFHAMNAAGLAPEVAVIEPFRAR